MVLYQTTPAPGDILSNSQPILLANSQYLQTSLGRDHNFTNDSTTTGDGFHKSIHMIVQADQAPTANVLTFYQKITDGDTNLYASTSLEQGLRLTTFNSTFDYTFFGTNTNYIFPTLPVTTLGGWTYLPGGLIMAYGSLVSTGGNTTVAFPVTFNSVFSVVASRNQGSGSNAAYGVNTVGTTNFIFSSDSSTAGIGIFWIAIGN